MSLVSREGRGSQVGSGKGKESPVLSQSPPGCWSLVPGLHPRWPLSCCPSELLELSRSWLPPPMQTVFFQETPWQGAGLLGVLRRDVPQSLLQAADSALSPTRPISVSRGVPHRRPPAAAGTELAAGAGGVHTHLRLTPADRASVCVRSHFHKHPDSLSTPLKTPPRPQTAKGVLHTYRQKEPGNPPRLHS